MKGTLAIAALLTVTAVFAQAPEDSGVGAGAPQTGVPAQAPSPLSDVSIDQRLGSALPLGTELRDETGRAVRLGDVFRGRPVLMDFVYYTCPMLCSYDETGTLKAMRALSFTAGREFDVVSISIDPADLPSIAATKRRDFLQRYGRPAAGGIHFLTGPAESIAAITRAAGFRYAPDPETKGFSHAAGLILATPDGRLSKYFYGIEYSARDMRLAIIEASNARIGTPVDRLLLYCSHWDPQTGKYGLAVMRAVRLGGAATAVSLGVFMAVMLRRERRRKT